MKKQIQKIIGMSLMFTLFLNGGAVTFAQDNETLTLAEEACAPLIPNYDEDKEIASLIENAEAINYEVYAAVFERSQLIYHSYVGCLFEYAESTVYKDDKFKQRGIVEANTPNTKVIDWMVPDQACLAQTEINQIINDSSPEQMLGPVLKAHSDYSAHLNELGESYSSLVFYVGDLPIRATSDEGLYERTSTVERINLERQMEIDSSLVTIDLMFSYLKELRMAFVMHVHFQCTLKGLEKYRKALEELRNLIEPLPDQLRDASIS